MVAAGMAAVAVHTVAALVDRTAAALVDRTAAAPAGYTAVADKTSVPPALPDHSFAAGSAHYSVPSACMVPGLPMPSVDMTDRTATSVRSFVADLVRYFVSSDYMADCTVEPGRNIAADTADHIPTVPVHCSAYLSVPDYSLMTIYHPCGYHLHYSVHPCCYLRCNYSTHPLTCRDTSSDTVLYTTEVSLQPPPEFLWQ